MIRIAAETESEGLASLSSQVIYYWLFQGGASVLFPRRPFSVVVEVRALV